MLTALVKRKYKGDEEDRQKEKRMIVKRNKGRKTVKKTEQRKERKD